MKFAMLAFFFCFEGIQSKHSNLNLADMLISGHLFISYHPSWKFSAKYLLLIHIHYIFRHGENLLMNVLIQKS